MGCCDSSRGKHATAHFHDVKHPVVQSAVPGESWKFFEIDQSMVDAARDPKNFRYISSCLPDMKPVIGASSLRRRVHSAVSG